ncbi:MAG: hypothetical protein QG564_1809 [Campylobacterota bacterium]|nr:hypothetical protein [Campylobacterota bacterium]
MNNHLPIKSRKAIEKLSKKELEKEINMYEDMLENWMFAPNNRARLTMIYCFNSFNYCKFIYSKL